VDNEKKVLYNKSTSIREMKYMEVIIKLKRELVDDNIANIFVGLETSIVTYKDWLSLKVNYEDTDVQLLSFHLNVLLKDYFRHSERVGMRINDMPYVATRDNKNIRTIMQKLLK